MDDEKTLPFYAHLEELRTRLIRCFIAVIIGFIPSYYFKEQIFKILVTPLIAVMQQDDKMVFTGLPEAFFTYLKVSFLSGIMIASPIILYQFWMFVAPGLYKKEKRVLLPIIILSVFFFLGGALFGYFIVFPFGFEFFLSFTSDTIQALPSMSQYLGFASKMLLAFGIVFELPLILTAMARLGLVTVKLLRKNRKYAILLFFTCAAVLTPPDVVTQIMMALPLIILYEISILGAIIFGKKPSDDKNEDNIEK